MPDDLFIFLQKILPKQTLTEMAGALARRRLGWITQRTIARFVRKYQVNMAEAAQPSLTAYPTFNDFFTRALAPGVRPLATSPWVSPVDGCISQLGRIQQGQIFQAKGHHYSATQILGGHSEAAQAYENGHFATIYLSPRDYHRIHMPCDARLIQMSHVPGTLYSVNPVTARRIPALFARNERVVCHFESAHGPFVMVLVGATIVGSMATVWHGLVNPPRTGTIRYWDYRDQHIVLRQGEEMGRFLLGSTVVLCWPETADLTFESHWSAEKTVRMGEAMANKTIQTQQP